MKDLLQAIITTIDASNHSSSAIGVGLKNVCKALMDDGTMEVEKIGESRVLTNELLKKDEWFNKDSVKKIIGNALKELSDKHAAEDIELYAFHSLMKSYGRLEPSAKLRKLQVGPQKESELASYAGIKIRKGIIESASKNEIARICKKYYTNPASLTEQERKIFETRKQKMAAEAGIKISKKS